MRSVDLIVIAGLPPPGLSFPFPPRHGWAGAQEAGEGLKGEMHLGSVHLQAWGRFNNCIV